MAPGCRRAHQPGPRHATAPCPWPAARAAPPQHNDGSGGECVFKPGRGALADGCLPDESFLLRHTGRGILSLASHRGPDTGASAFNLTLGPCPLLDERAVVFGYVVAGRGVLDAIEAAGDGDGWPTRRVTIGACGQVTGDGSAQPASVTRRASVAAGSRPASPGPPSAAGSRPASPAGPSASGAPPSAMAAGPGAGNDGRASGRAGDGAGATRAGASSGGPASGAAPGVAHYTTSAQAWPTGPGPRRHGPGGRTVADLEASGDLPRSLTPLQEAARRYGSNAAGRSHATVRASGGNEGAPGAGEGAPGGGQGAAGEGGGEGGRRRGAGDHGGRSE